MRPKTSSKSPCLTISSPAPSAAKGQNVKLAAKLLGWKIDIFTETRYNETNAIGRGLEQVASVAEVSVDSLVSAGFTTLEQLQDATDEELSEKLSLSDSPYRRFACGYQLPLSRSGRIG